MKNGDYILVVAPDWYKGKRYRKRYCYEHHLVWEKETGCPVPDAYWQSFAMYKPNIILNGSLPIKVECEYFWEVDEARDKTLPTEVVNNRYERDWKWDGIK